MEQLLFLKNDIYITFAVDQKGHLLILNISDRQEEVSIEENRFYVPLEIHTTGSNPDDHHGCKHTGGDELFYQGHEEQENSINFVLGNDRISAKLIYEFFPNTKVMRVHSEVTNISEEKIGLEYISSFCMYGIKPERISIPHNGWCQELFWQEYTPEELGYLVKTKGFSTKRISVSNTGTWPTKEYLPMGMLKSEDKTIFWQIEHNGSWNWEISDIAKTHYLKLSGPSEQENGWWKELKPGDTFCSVTAGVCVVSGDFSDAVAEMNTYRRHIAYRSEADKKLPVIFNDYLLCLGADPTTEKELPVIDAAAKAGAEVFCMDAGWYADGTWWETVGEWKVCEKRFSNGMKEVFDYIRARGMIPGIWLEPESMGINCPILDKFEDNCFFMRHGKKVIDHGRYQLDFRQKKVTDYLDQIVDGLIEDYGIGYFKFDYNIDGGVGTERDADSYGDGLMQHNAAFLKWVDGIYERHPDLIIENCASGGMRMEYKTLSHFSLQSLTDATDCYRTVVLAAMSPTAVLPEQAAVWCFPQKDSSMGEVAVHVVNAMFKRVHLSGQIPWLEQEKFELVQEGIEFYKSIREKIPAMQVFYPLGMIDYTSDWAVSGYTDGEKTYLCVTNMSGSGVIEIPLAKEIEAAEVVYPQKSAAKLRAEGNKLTVFLPNKYAVIIASKQVYPWNKSDQDQHDICSPKTAN